jgi:hypothetical protein
LPDWDIFWVRVSIDHHNLLNICCAEMETSEDMERRHEREIQELHVQIQAMMKGAKKSVRAQLEAQAIQQQFDLKAKHREEEDELEERLGK